MIPSNLVNALGYPFPLSGALGFNDNNRDAVYQKDNIPPVCVLSVRELPFIRYMELIVSDVFKVNEVYVQLPPPPGVINAIFPPEIQQDLLVAFY